MNSNKIQSIRAKTGSSILSTQSPNITFATLLSGTVCFSIRSHQQWQFCVFIRWSLVLAVDSDVNSLWFGADPRPCFARCRLGYSLMFPNVNAKHFFLSNKAAVCCNIGFPISPSFFFSNINMALRFTKPLEYISSFIVVFEWWRRITQMNDINTHSQK